VHIGRVLLRNIKSMRELDWNREDKGELAGWHVILGGNGSGKSSVLRAIALGLNGPREVAALRIDFKTWLRAGTDSGQVTVTVIDHPRWDISGSDRKHENDWLPATLTLARSNGFVLLLEEPDSLRTHEHLWGNHLGWFAASYGPFRRFQGGDKDLEKLYESYPKIARHLTLFGENVALSECTEWLRNLKFRELENQKAGDAEGGAEGRLLRDLMTFVNSSELLPHAIVLSEVRADGVMFIDANGAHVSVEELSDGYRSVLSMTFEIIRQLHATWPLEDTLFDDEFRIRAPGVVMIDEVDVHLHPKWQREIGHWFTRQFPNFQFIVTTHSPLICQAATRGSIFRLPTPGTDETPRFIEGIERDRLLYGNVLDAYATDGFGNVPTRSDEGVERLERLAELDTKAREEGLSDEERVERERLVRVFPSG
jgi:hypothetical protein